MEFFFTSDPVTQAFIATLGTWAVTALGASVVFLQREPSRKFLDVMLGFAGGVMLAASFWSLLAPSLVLAAELGWIEWLPAAAGFLTGGIFLRIADRLIPHFHSGTGETEGLHTDFQRTTLMILAITLHNIPEGLAVGVAFGAIKAGIPHAGVESAIALAIGIALQNFPEGMAVSLPLRRSGLSRMKSFMGGQYSGIVEPIAGVLGAWLVTVARPVLPFALAFAAGAMVFVVVEDVVPESQSGGNGDAATIGVMLGFTVMMIMDVAFA